MGESMVVTILILPALVFIAMAVLLFLSNSVENAIDYCEDGRCGSIPNVILYTCRLILQILSVPVSILVVILSVVLLSIMAVVQVIVWGFVMMVSNPIGIAVLFVLLVMYAQSQG